MPEWICEMWISDYGFDVTEEMLKFFLEPRPTTVRLNIDKIRDRYARAHKTLPDERKTSEDLDINTNKANGRIKSENDEKRNGVDENHGNKQTESVEIDSYIRDLESAGVIVHKNKILPYALDLEKTDNIRYLPGFDDGLFFVQDVSSMLVTEIAAPHHGQVVVDVCAAPGGKSLHAAERGAEVLSRDVSEYKCDLIRENAERLGLENIEAEVHDALIHDRNLENKADILYLDLPCSGLGIIGRKTDIKYNASQKGLNDLTALQWDIIKSSWDYVKKGGILMYSTCTVDRAENEEMVRKICTELPFEPVDFSSALPTALADHSFAKSANNGAPEDDSKINAYEILKSTAEKGYIQLLPGQFGTDGFFIAGLRRV